PGSRNRRPGRDTVGILCPEPGWSLPRGVIQQGAWGRPRPAERNCLYRDAGYIFGRSGWGRSRPYDKEMYYTARFGPGRDAHGQNDHTSLTFFAQGRNLIVEPGHIGYDAGNWRTWLQSPQSHNALTEAGATFRANSPTALDFVRFRTGGDEFR